MSSERGFTLPELMIGMSMALIVIFASFALLETANRSSARTVARVDANQQARPVMERIMDELRSSCVRRDIAPVIDGSTATSLSFLHETGSSVLPVPDKRTITLSGGTLTESAFQASPATQNADGRWTFSSTPIAGSTRVLLTNVATANVDNANVALFRYFTYTNGALTEITALPLSVVDAARVAQVDVSFAASPLRNPTRDALAAITLTDSALLRFGPPSESASATNLPCT